MTDYVMFGRPTYGADDGHQFELTVSRKGIYCCADITRPEATELVADIQRHLELDPGRLMTELDLGLEVPEDLGRLMTELDLGLEVPEDLPF